MKLSEKSRAILEAIAKGHTYEQILVQDLAWTYHDIFAAVQEALALAGAGQPLSMPARSGAEDGDGKAYDVEKIRQAHAQAYQPWTPEEEKRLIALFNAGRPVEEMARDLGRQPGGIRSRLHKLNLVA